MQELILSPDEVLSPTPAPLAGEASGPIALFWRGKNRPFWFRSVELLPRKHVVFVCEAGRENAGNWLVYERGDMVLATRALTPPHRKIENLVLNWNPETHGLGRFFVVRGRKNKVSRLLLGDDGIGVWLEGKLRSVSHFDFTLDSHLFENSRADVGEFLKRELADFDSAISFAGRWSSLDFQDRYDVMLGENLGQLEQVMRWILRCEPRLWELDNGWTWFLLPQSERINLRGRHEADEFENYAVEVPFFVRMNQLLKDYELRLSAPLLEKHRCVRNLLRFDLSAQVHLETPPTAQEQREAASQLRQWLRDKVSDAEAARLLPP